MSALNGQIEVGDVVRVVTYSPSAYDNEDGSRRHYITYEAMIVGGITEDYDEHEYRRSLGADLPPKIVTRYWLKDVDRPNDESRMIWVGADRADLSHVVDDGAFF